MRILPLLFLSACDTPTEQSREPATCEVRSCEQAGAECGGIDDGCNSELLACGNCPSSEICGEGNTCIPRTCTPSTCAEMGAECGAIDDGCGATIGCGGCPTPQTCGGQQVANECGQPECTDQVRVQCVDEQLYWFDSCGQQQERKQDCGDLGCEAGACLTWQDQWSCLEEYYDSNDGCDCDCGVLDPDCQKAGQQLYNCDDDMVCSASGQCIPAPCSDDCPAVGDQSCSQGNLSACEVGPQGCNEWSQPTSCGSGFCESSNSCGACEHACEAGQSLCEEGGLRSCVADSNGCRVWSGSTGCTEGYCADNSTCGACIPTTCAAEGANCESIDDGCEGTLDCGFCDAPETCGGGGEVQICGCTPESDGEFCARLGFTCGEVVSNDNCGAVRQVASCGGCSGKLVCDASNLCVPYSEPMEPICGPSGWCWENPMPQGKDLYGAHTIEGSTWVVGDEGVALRWNGSIWSGSFGMTTESLHAVWGASNANIWAVGGDGVIAHYNGLAWSLVDSPVPGRRLNGLWGASSTAIWAVGQAGTVLHFDGNEWSEVAVPTERELQAVWGTSANNVWVVGNQALLHWDGVQWTESPTAYDLKDIWGASASDIWAVGTNGGLRWTGASWVNQSIEGRAVRGTSATDVWVVKDLLTGEHFDGFSWTSVPLASGTRWYNSIHALAASSDGMVAVGNGGLMYRLTSSEWQLVTQGFTSLVPERLSMSTIAVGPGGVGYVAGYRWGSGFDRVSFSMQRSGSHWESGGLWNSRRIYGLSLTSASNMWAVTGSYDKIYRRDASGWRITDTVNDANLYSVVTFSPTDVWAVGDDQTHHWDGLEWTPIPNPTSGTDVVLVQVAGASDDLWASGSDGTLLHWNGEAWSAVPSGTSNSITSLSAPTSDFAVATTGQELLLWDGESWSVQQIAAREVWSLKAGEIWARMNSGLSHYVDGAWTSVLAPGDVMDIAGWEDELWLLRNDGSILRR